MIDCQKGFQHSGITLFISTDKIPVATDDDASVYGLFKCLILKTWLREK